MQLPANLDFALYFNVAFFGMIGLGMLFGFLRGFKKSLFSFIVVLGLYAIFFLTIDLAVNFLWTLNTPLIGQGFAMILPQLSTATSLEAALPMALQTLVPAEYVAVLSNAELLAFVTGLALFVVKIVWLILYFTVFNLIYRLIFFLIRIIFFPTKKNREKYGSKNRGLGALFGLLNGVVTVFVSLIMFGGLISISESLVAIAPANNPDDVEMAFPRQEIYQAEYSIVPLAVEIPIPAEFEDAVAMLNDMVTSYNANIVVSTAAQITLTDPTTQEEAQLNLYLFDSVLSFDYKGEEIAIRHELQVITTVMAQLLDSEYISSSDLSDLTGDEIRLAFQTIADSKLLTSLIPIGIEVGAEFLETNITVPTEELYAIDWSTEIAQLGDIAGTVFDLVNAAGLLSGSVDLQTVTLDGDDARDLFDSLGQSDLITLGAYVAMEPLLEQLGGTISAVITVPEDLVWEDEFAAFGEIIGAILDTGISFGVFERADPFEIITALATLDFTVILNSKIVTQALINIFEGALDIEELNMIIIPAGIRWLDELDGDGNIILNGELRNILLAINAIGSIAVTIDFNNLSINSLSGLTEEAINSLFESRILVATISDYLLNQDLGLPLIIPDSVFDEDGYLLKSELQALSASLTLVVGTLLCDEGDTACEENGFGFDISKAFSLEGDDIDTLLASDILAATVGDLIVTMTADLDTLVIPDSALTEIFVKEIAQDVVSREEISRMFQAVTVLGISDFENLSIDPSILQILGLESDPTTLDPDKSEKLFASEIIHATLSDLILGFAEGVDAFLSVPYQDEDNNVIRYTSGGIEYISRTELEAVLQAVLSLDIQDFNNFESLDLSLITDNSATLLASAILHATVSDQLFTLGGDIVTIPYVDQDDVPIRITVGDVGFETEYISKTELQAIFDALAILDITDITSFDGNVDLAIISEGDNLLTLLASAILHATVSTQVLDLTGGGLIDVPYMASDGVTEIRITVGPVGYETEYISKDEINAVFDALEVLGISDVTTFDGNVDLSVLTEEGNLDILLASSVIHATVSLQVFDLTSGDTPLLTVPYVAEDGVTEIRKTVGEVGYETEYLTKAEINAVFDALDVLGISDVTTFDGNIDLSVLSVEGNLDILLSSSIIQATVSQQVFDLTTGDTPLLTVPYVAEDGLTAIRITVGDVGYETEYITKDEINAIFDALDVLGISDVTTFDGNIDLSVLSVEGNLDILLSSSIIQATVSQQVFDLATGDSPLLTVPYVAEDGLTAIRITVGDVGYETEYITKDEISAVFDALDVLGISDVTTFDGNIDLSVLSEEGNLDILLTSSIIQATVSQQVFDLATDGFIFVPYVEEDGVTEIRVTVGPLGFETEYIIKSEISAVFDALDVLGISDVTTFDGNLDLSVLSVEGNVDILLSSSIIQATVSNQIFDLGIDGTLDVPYVAEDGITEIRVTVGPLGDETEYLIKTEISAIFEALNVLGINDVTTFNGSVDLSLISEGDNATIILSSSVIQATVSTQLIDLEVSGTLIVPFFADDDITAIRVTVGPLGFETEYVIKAELEAIFDALDVLGITDVETFDGSVDLSLLAIEGNSAILLASSTIQATVSKQVIDLESGGTLTVPYMADDDVTAIRITVGSAPNQTEYIIKTELSAMIDALNILGITDVESFNGSVDLSVITEGNNADTLLLSSVIQATVSKQVFDLGTGGTLEIPFYQEDGVTLIQVVTGPLGFETTYLIKSELKSIFESLDILGLTDLETFSGSVDLSTLATGTNAETVMASAIIQATVSKQVLDLDVAGTIEVPFMADDDTTEIRITVGLLLEATDYIKASELVAMIHALDLLGITDVETFDGTVDLTGFFDETNRNILLSSSVMQATISKQLLDLGVATLTVPYTDSSLTDVRLMTGPLGFETEYVSKAEISAIFESLEILGITDVNSFSGDIDLTSFYVQENRDILLASASMHATISKQLFDLGAATLTIPYVASDNVTDIRVFVGPLGFETEFVVKTEIDAMFESLEMLGITDITTFDGTIDLTSFYIQGNRDILLASASMHATVSKQLLDLGAATLTVPYMASDDTTAIRVLTGPLGFETEFVVKIEIDAMFESLEMLGITDITTFDGTIDLTSFFVQENRDILLASASMHATISKQLLDLGPATLSVPYVASDSVTAIRVFTGPLGFEIEFVIKTEIDAMFESLEILGITDITTFDGTIDLTSFYIQGNRDILLASASMHATVSKQLLDLGEATLSVPYVASDDVTAIRLTVGSLGFQTEYVTKEEIDAMFESLEILGITDITTFNGTINLTNFYDQANRDILLASASMHATVSKQLLDLGDAVLVVPMDDATASAVRLTVGVPGFRTEYVSKEEIHAMFEALELLGITDITSFDGAVNLNLIYGDTNQNILLASASMHATITKQLDDLGSTVLLVPLTDVDGTSIQATVSGTHFIFKVEIKAIIDSLEILGITDITSFTGSVSLVNLFNETNQNTLLSSASMHATITKQLDDLGSSVLLIPATDVSNAAIQAIVSTTHFIFKDEIKAIINSLEILGINDITTFDGTVSLVNLFNDTNQNILLSSASMHATITKQLDDLGSSVLLIPATNVSNVAIQAIVSATHFIFKDEIKAIINSLEILGINDITTFDGTVSLVNLFNDTNQTILLSSASMHATITKQIDDLGSSVLLVPATDVTDTAIQATVSLTHFIFKTEIKAIINALEILGVTDITSFDGTVSLANLFNDANQTTLLLSASMHATITKQLDDLGSSVLLIPHTNYDGTVVEDTVSLTHFIYASEIKAIINALEILGVTDITTFDGTFDISALALGADQDTVLLSASMHATISKTMLDLGDAVLIVPIYSQLGETEPNRIQKTVSLTDFIIKGEIKALIDAFLVMGYTDLNTFGASIDSSKFFDDPNTLLLSSSIQATLSDKLINGTGGVLIIPNTNYAGDYTIRIVLTDVTYIELVEIKAILVSLELLNLTDFSSISINPANVFAADFNTLFLSYAMQATVSDTLLSGALDDSAAAGCGSLIVPNFFRETLNVGAGTNAQIELVELKALLTALETLGVSDFSGAVDAGVVTSLSDAQLNTLLISGSMQVTVDNMLKGNTNINTSIPDLAVEDVYGMTDITTKIEIKAFIKAATTVGGTNISSVDFNLAAIAALTPAEQDTVLSSMIVRNMVTSDLETAVAAKNVANFPGGPFYTIDNSDYEESNPALFFTKQGAIDAIAFINS